MNSSSLYVTLKTQTLIKMFLQEKEQKLAYLQKAIDAVGTLKLSTLLFVMTPFALSYPSQL